MGNQKKILVVDDDQDYVAGVQMILEANNYAVVTAYNPDEGLQKAVNDKPDLILLDIMMGKKAEGILFARKIRQNSEYSACSKIPILVMTGMREQTGFWFPKEPKNSVFFPIDTIIEKPLKPAPLLEKIRDMLAQQTKAAP